MESACLVLEALTDLVCAVASTAPHLLSLDLDTTILACSLLKYGGFKVLYVFSNVTFLRGVMPLLIDQRFHSHCIRLVTAVSQAWLLQPEPPKLYEVKTEITELKLPSDAGVRKSWEAASEFFLNSIPAVCETLLKWGKTGRHHGKPGESGVVSAEERSQIPAPYEEPKDPSAPVIVGHIGDAKRRPAATGVALPGASESKTVPPSTEEQGGGGGGESKESQSTQEEEMEKQLHLLGVHRAIPPCFEALAAHATQGATILGLSKGGEQSVHGVVLVVSTAFQL